MCACEDNAPSGTAALKAHYESLAEYLEWQAAEPLFAYECASKEDIEKTDYLDQARALGAAL